MVGKQEALFLTASAIQAPKFPGRKGSQEGEVIDNGKLWGKGVDKIFPAQNINAVFHSDTGIVLSKNRGRHADVRQPSVSDSRGINDSIEHGAAYHQCKRMPAQVKFPDELYYRVDDLHRLGTVFAGITLTGSEDAAQSIVYIFGFSRAFQVLGFTAYSRQGAKSVVQAS